VEDTFRQERNAIAISIDSSVRQCRSLAPDYQVEFRRLTEREQTAACVRHLRLNLIADADIPKIGARRKQVLASFRIFTAADIDDRVIREIEGFGNALTRSLVSWKQEVLQQFRFDPTRDISPVEKRHLTATFRNKHQHILAELNRHARGFDTLVSRREIEIQKLTSEMEQVSAQYWKATIDLKVLSEKH
jgi:DNA-binding helix-hairpin-helix protein with protein kinase domain